MRRQLARSVRAIEEEQGSLLAALKGELEALRAENALASKENDARSSLLAASMEELQTVRAERAALRDEVNALTLRLKAGG